MQLKTKRILQYFAVLTLVMAVSCSKEDPEPIQPDYPQFIGTWKGTTSQNQSLTLGVINLEGLLVINVYDYTVIHYDSLEGPQPRHYQLTSQTPFSSVVNRYFKFTPAGPAYSHDYLSGLFNDTTMVLSGEFSALFTKSSGTGSDIVTGTYTATKISD